MIRLAWKLDRDNSQLENLPETREIIGNKIAKKELVHQNKLLEALFKNSTDAIAYFDEKESCKINCRRF